MKHANSLIPAILVAVGFAWTGSAKAAEQMWTGQISDSMCGVKHMADEHGKAKSDRDCTRMCAGHGAEYVLVADGKVYKLRNHDADLKTHAGHTVNLSGELKDDTIRVSKIEMPSAEKK